MCAAAPGQEERYQHKYAYDWRTKQPCIYRCTDQWFASVEGFRRALPACVAAICQLSAAHPAHATMAGSLPGQPLTSTSRNQLLCLAFGP